ncbi:MAG: hypothetical protein AAF206_28430, partial [Bacteroidota bacterium]
SLSEELQSVLLDQATRLAKALNVVGLMNTQFAIQGDAVYRNFLLTYIMESFSLINEDIL